MSHKYDAMKKLLHDAGALWYSAKACVMPWSETKALSEGDSNHEKRHPSGVR